MLDNFDSIRIILCLTSSSVNNKKACLQVLSWATHSPGLEHGCSEAKTKLKGVDDAGLPYVHWCQQQCDFSVPTHSWCFSYRRTRLYHLRPRKNTIMRCVGTIEDSVLSQWPPVSYPSLPPDSEPAAVKCIIVGSYITGGENSCGDHKHSVVVMWPPCIRVC